MVVEALSRRPHKHQTNIQQEDRDLLVEVVEFSSEQTMCLVENLSFD